MESKEQLQQVAIHCSHFMQVSEGGLQSSVRSNTSCENCKHFTKDHRCDIDLIDKVLVNIPRHEC